MQIAILNLPQTLKSALYGIEEIFFINNKYCKNENEIKIQTKILELEDLDETVFFHMIIIPPLMSGEGFDFNLPILNKWLIKQYQNNAILCSACVGSFFLANTKLLDNKKATTHWAYRDYFEENFQKV